MWKIPLLAKKKDKSGVSRKQDKGCYPLARPLPIFYMSDYSVLGLLVDQLEEAVRVLGENQFSVFDEAGDLEVAMKHPSQLPEIVRLLQDKGIGSEIADVVSGIYQG